MNEGPSPFRARSTASFVALYVAKISLPSAWIVGISYASAFCAKVLDAVCWQQAVEIAQPLFRQQKTTGTFSSDAKFIASWKSPVLVAPSPRKQRTTRSSL